MLIIITILTCWTFYQAAMSFDDGVRLPVFSFTQDAANHMMATKEILDTNRLTTNYPLGFHSNVWLMETLAKTLVGSNNYDQISFVNIFSIFTVFTMVILTGLIYLNIEYLISSTSNNKKIILKLLLTFLVTYFGMIIPYYLLADGFYSMWFNQIFILAIIFFLTSNFKKREDFLYIFTPLIIGFVYSYIFFIPALLIFFIILALANKRNVYLILLLITMIFSALTVIKFFQIENRGLWLANASGVFADYSVVLVFAYFVPTVFYLYYFYKHSFKKIYILIHAALSFLIFALLLASYQFITTGSTQYSFYKTFSTVMMIFAIFSIITIYKLLERVYFKLNFSKSVLFIYLIGTIYSLWRFFPLMSDYTYQNFTHGLYNFFGNNKEKYNAISFVSENMNDFDKYIYVDQNFSSSQWGSKLLKINGLNSLNKNSVFNQGIETYINIIENLLENERLLVVDPTRYLHVSCDAEEFIFLAKSEKLKDKVIFYPYFDLEIWEKNCHSKLSV